MSFCEIDDVEALFQETFDTTTVPTSAEVTEFITDVSDEIESILIGQGFTTDSITSASAPKAFKKLKRLNVNGAAAEVLHAKTRHEPVPTDREIDFRTRYTDGLTELRRNPQDIRNEMTAEPVETLALPASTLDEVDVEEKGNTESYFKRSSDSTRNNNT